jgi:hypothetical protein
VLTAGPDDGGHDSLAVWRLGSTGQAVGAWVLRLDHCADDPGLLRSVLASLGGRSVIDWAADAPAAALAGVAGLVDDGSAEALAARIVLIPDLLTEIAEHRAAYATALESYRSGSKSKIAPFTWTTEVPADPEAARATLSPAQPAAASPVAAAALSIAGAVERAVELWTDTEQIRYRRPYLRALGEPQVLPPRWRGRLAARPGSSR